MFCDVAPSFGRCGLLAEQVEPDDGDYFVPRQLTTKQVVPDGCNDLLPVDDAVVVVVIWETDTQLFRSQAVLSLSVLRRASGYIHGDHGDGSRHHVERIVRFRLIAPVRFSAMAVGHSYIIEYQIQTPAGRT